MQLSLQLASKLAELQRVSGCQVSFSSVGGDRGVLVINHPGLESEIRLVLRDVRESLPKSLRTAATTTR